MFHIESFSTGRPCREIPEGPATESVSSSGGINIQKLHEISTNVEKSHPTNHTFLHCGINNECCWYKNLFLFQKIENLYFWIFYAFFHFTPPTPHTNLTVGRTVSLEWIVCVFLDISCNLMKINYTTDTRCLPNNKGTVFVGWIFYTFLNISCYFLKGKLKPLTLDTDLMWREGFVNLCREAPKKFCKAFKWPALYEIPKGNFVKHLLAHFMKPPGAFKCGALWRSQESCKAP